MAVYLNHAGTSWPKPRDVREACVDALAAPPTTWAARFEAQHARIAARLGYTAEQVLLTPGCTAALALALSDPRWRRGDRLVVDGMAHHALRRPALLLEAHGVEVVTVPRAVDGPFDLDALEDALRRGARMVAVTAASNVTGECLPLAEVVALCRVHGATSLVDAAQLAGWTDELAHLGADLVTFAGHKGPQAPWGVGGLLFGPDADLPSPRDGAPRVGWCDGGSVDRVAMAGLAAGLDWLARRPWRLARALELTARLAEGLRDLGGHVLGTGHGVPIVSVTFPDRTPAELGRHLASRGITTSAGLHCAPHAHHQLGTAQGGALRFSVGVPTTPDDVDLAVDVLAAR